MEQKSHKWIFKVLAKNNAHIFLLDTFFLKTGTLELLIYTDNDGYVRQKLPRDLQYRNLGDLLISLKKEFKAFQKVSNIGKYACIIVGRNLKVKLDLSGLKEYRNRVQTFPLLQYLQKIKPHNRSDEGWYTLTLTYTEKTYKSEFLWKEIDKEIPSTQRLVFEMAKNIATVIISVVEKEEGDRKRVVKLEMNLTLDDLGVLWLMSCNCTLNLKEEMMGNETIGNENMQIFDIRSRNRKKTLYKDRNEDSDKPKIIRSDSPIRIKSPNNSNNGPTPRPSEEGPPSHPPLNRTVSIAAHRLSFNQEQKSINGGMSPEHRRANRSKTTQFAPFSFHAFNYKFFRDADPCKNSNASLTEESSMEEDEDSLSDGSINVHFLEILGRERCKIKCRVGNPLRNPTPGVEELKQEMRHIRERIKSYEEESAARRNMIRRNSRCIRKNSWIASKKIKPNQFYDNIKRSDTKPYLQTMKTEDGLLSPLSSIDSPASPLKLKKIASKSIENGKSKTPKSMLSHNTQPLLNKLQWKANTATHSPANFKDTKKIGSPNPSLPALSRITSHVLQVPKNRKLDFNPLSTYHSRFRSLQT
ncbi:unnamed protein product [Blepharisma stoltei]|uniref:Uncharacterized protein n=1 Tax=Blepharisma stoltei TaxID=1481888 RepID=A0AAU9JC15_9CILI|nr:unnamed protein product [Blepharisma stoltei]